MDELIAVGVESLSKRYRIGQRERYKALRDVTTDALGSPLRRLRANLQSAIVNRQLQIENEPVSSSNNVL